MDTIPERDGWKAETRPGRHSNTLEDIIRIRWARYAPLEKPFKPDDSRAPHYGLNRNRFSREPEEKRFADHWEQEQTPDNSGRGLLEHILSTTNEPVEPNTRDRQVAATVVQWLGSSVGRCFLEELGYVHVIKE